MISWSRTLVITSIISQDAVTTILFLDLIPQKRGLLAKWKLRLNEVMSVEVTVNNKAEEYYISGVELHEQGHIEQSIVEYTTAIELDPDLVMAYLMRGMAYASRWETAEAISDLERCIALSIYPGLSRGTSRYRW